MKRFTSYEQANQWLLKIAKETNKDALKEVSQQAYKDVKKYTPIDTQDMYLSGSLHSDFKKGIVSMVAPQVRRLYYIDFNAGSGNPRAKPFWWEAIKSEQAKNWKKIYIKLFKMNKR